MQRLSSAPAVETEDEYRAIEAALLESARGRWFLAEHGRRARRLDSALLEDAIGRLQTSLRQPPALLDQLQGEIGDLKAHIEAMREELMSRTGVTSSAAEAGAPLAGMMLKATEQIHEIAWNLQANPFDPKGCEELARHAAQLYSMSQDQAAHSERTLAISNALAEATARADAMLETIRHERLVDGPPSPP